MRTTDDRTHESVIGDFYSEFPYPWHVSRLARPHDPTLVAALTSQELGDFGHTRIPAGATIWVPGCGVNQALITALRHPHATVLGSDVSDESLRMCATAARQVGAGNLELRHEGISEAGYDQEFDYIVCTGVVHHNPDPAALLRRLTAALKPAGVLELMVYNSFHRREITAFQEASAILGCDGDLGDAKRLARAVGGGTVLTEALLPALDEPDVKFADTWLNPYEKSYTVRSLAALAAGAGLALEAPCISPETVGQEFVRWQPPLSDERLLRRCERLPDARRWQLANLLLADKSPLLWFYLRRSGAGLPLLSEADRDRAFLAMVPEPADTAEQVWTLRASGGYQPVPARAPAYRLDEPTRPIVELADGRRTVAAILAALGSEPPPWELRRLRAMLTTPAFPVLRAVS